MKYKKNRIRIFTSLLISAVLLLGTVPSWVWADPVEAETESIAVEESGESEESAETVLYISDIKVATDSDSGSDGATRAKKQLTDAGYTVLDYDLNKGTKEGWAFIGYKTTTDPEDAITDLRVMDMNGGYVMADKESVLEDYRTQINQVNTALLTAAGEFAANYAKGSPRAAAAKEVLDYIYFPEHDDMPFGEYLVTATGKTQAELQERLAEWSDILLLCSQELSSLIYIELIQGCVDYDPDYVSQVTTASAGESSGNTAEAAVFTEGTAAAELADYTVSTSTGDVQSILTDEEIGISESGESAEDEIELSDGTDSVSDNGSDAEEEDGDEIDLDLAESGEETNGSTTDSDSTGETEENEDGEEEDVDLEDGSTADLGYTWLYRFSQQDASTLDAKTWNSASDSLLDAITNEADAYQEAAAVAETGRTDEQKLIVAAHDAMNRYSYTDADGTSMPIGDYLYQDDLTVEMLYPLAASLTSGQTALARIFGLKYFALNLENTSDSFADEYSTLTSGLSEIDGKVSLWYGYNEEMYADDVALTSDILRQQAAVNYDPEEYKNIYDEAGKKVVNLDEAYDLISDFNEYIGLALGVAVPAVIGLTMGITALVAGTSSALYTTLGVASSVLGTAGLVVSVCLLIIMGAIALYELYEYYHPEYTDIPNVIYDMTSTGAISGTRAYLRYELATNPAGEQVDLNVFEGKKWNCLYYTKDENAGSPITADFIVQYGNGANSDGYSPLCLFGKTNAWNLNTDDYKDSVKGVYVFMTRDGDEISNSNLKYISSLKVFTGTDERALLNEIASSGYSFVNSNLTPDSETYTYLGYQTTSDADYAVTDIRAGITGAYESGNTKLGDMGYTDAGEVCGGVHILYTINITSTADRSKVSYAGTPILSGDENFYVRYSRDEAVPDGVEPVNLLSGGPAFNFRYSASYKSKPVQGSDLAVSDYQTYLYFTPETQYKSTDEGATAYLGGLIFVAATDMYASQYADGCEALLNRFGYQMLDNSISSSMMTKRSAIGYYVTYNPYRALQGITAYSSSNAKDAVNPSTIKNTVTAVTTRRKKTTYTYADIPYTVVPVMEYSIERDTYYGSTGSVVIMENDYYVAARSDNAYNNQTFGSRSAGLYVTSGSGSLDPIRLSEWIVSETLNPDTVASDSSYRAVTTLLDITGSAANLRNGGTSSPLYMFYKGYADQQGQYISGVVLAGASLTDSYIDNLYSTKTKDERSAYKTMQESEYAETAIQNLVSSGASEYVSMISQSSSHSQYRYLALGVTRTDTAGSAIRDIKLVYVDSGSPPSKIERVLGYVGDKAYKAEYTLASKIPVYADSLAKDSSNPFKNGAYYLYTSKSSLCGQYITDLSVIGHAALDGTELVEAFTTADNTTLKSGSDAYSAETFELYRKAANQKAYDKISKYITISRQNANGETAGFRYITNLSAYVGYFKPNEEDKDELAYTTSYLLSTDMNKGVTGSRYIYLGYQRSYDSDAAITDIMAVRSSKKTSNDFLVKWVAGHYLYDSKNGEQWIPGKFVIYYRAADGLDFNKGAGGDYIYLYYTRDSSVASPITDLVVTTGKNNYNMDGYISVKFDDGSVADMNKKAGGDYIYLLARHERDESSNNYLNTGSMLMDGNLSMIFAFAAAGAGIWAVTFLWRRRRKKTKKM